MKINWPYIGLQLKKVGIISNIMQRLADLLLYTIKALQK